MCKTVEISTAKLINRFKPAAACVCAMKIKVASVWVHASVPVHSFLGCCVLSMHEASQVIRVFWLTAFSVFKTEC